ncbi:hypothetical protein EXN66_Car009641 [Channa argus]|uniref:Uncharacterized protein n=1 Tax=Channa argus TaxID=215402 RepID=A0A6G1PUM2_CHAAH|nr:hypothetical protein EXN66_Car009641 [Channa argus]
MGSIPIYSIPNIPNFQTHTTHEAVWRDMYPGGWKTSCHPVFICFSLIPTIVGQSF